jgi:hypothetical protein
MRMELRERKVRLIASCQKLRLLLGDLGVQEIADEALRLTLAPEGRGQRLVAQVTRHLRPGATDPGAGEIRTSQTEPTRLNLVRGTVPRLEPKTAYSRLSLVHGIYLKGKQRVEGSRSLSELRWSHKGGK